LKLYCIVFYRVKALVMDTIHIPAKDQYTVGTTKYFKFITFDKSNKMNVSHRDIDVDVSNWGKPTLVIFAKHLKIKKYSSMKKDELYNIIRPRITFE